MKKLAILLVFVAATSAQVSVRQREAASAPPVPGNPLTTAGPFPSLIPYASLNQWAGPSGSGKDTYRWQAEHIAAAHGDDQAVGMLNAAKSFYAVKYRLLESELTTDPSIKEAVRYCTETLKQSSPESLFYHYRDDTVLKGVPIRSISRRSNVVTVTLEKTYVLDAAIPDTVVIDSVTDPNFNGTFTVTKVVSEREFKYAQTSADSKSTGGSAALKITGCGDSTTCPAKSRIVNPAFGSPASRRYLWNHGDDTCARAYLKYRSLRDVTDKIEGTAGHFRAIFWDELGQSDFCTVGPAGIGCTAMPVVTDGGTVKELGLTAQQAVDAHTYDANLNGLLAAITNHLHEQTGKDALNFPNAAQCAAGPPGSGLNVSCYNHALNSDGMLTEFWDDESQGWMGSKGVQVLWRSTDSITDQKKIFIWAQDNTMPSAKSYGTCADHYKSKTMRHQMWSLSNYWLIKQGTYVWYAQQPVASQSYKQGFIAAQQYDIGSPAGSAEACSDVADPDKTKCIAGNRYLWKSGTDSDGHTFQIYRRNYSKGIVLSTPRTSNEDGFPPNYAATTASFSLPSAYSILQGDGTLGDALTAINMCRFEGVVLVPAKTMQIQ
jgi:hypothetical protein